jgi:hypothetical protein
MRRQVNHAKALQEAQRGDGCVKVQARGKTGAKDKTESLNWIHGLENSQIGNQALNPRYHERGGKWMRGRISRDGRAGDPEQ